MNKFVFSHPTDGLDRNDLLGTITILLRTRGEDYWNDPECGGFADLSYFPEGMGNEDGPGRVSSLTITKLDRLGVHLSYLYEVGDLDSPYYREAEYFYSHNGGSFAKRSPVKDPHEGNIFIFDALFVPVETAIAAVRQFLIDAGRSPEVNWIDFGQVRRAERALGE